MRTHSMGGGRQTQLRAYGLLGMESEYKLQLTPVVAKWHWVKCFKERRTVFYHVSQCRCNQH